jgi:hypothetical protein
VGVGKRQVLSIGGTASDWTDRDPAPQGLLLFDMTDMKWKNEYDANAAAYQRPAGINTWYNNGYVVHTPGWGSFLLMSQSSFDAVQWSSDEVRKLFSTKSTGMS